MREELIKAILLLIEYSFKHGEMLNAYKIITNAPALVRDNEELEFWKKRIEKRLDCISGFQTSGRIGSGFVDPDIKTKIAYKKLKEELTGKDIVSIVDIGCFSGWLGRNLSIWGYKVHGIDLDEETLKQATYMASGTRATFEVLPVEQLGAVHLGEFDAAVCFDVIEHLFDPTLALESIELAVKSGGWIFINLPHEREEAKGGEFPDELREHLHVFTEKDIKNMFEDRKNLKIELITNEKGDINWFISYSI